jgi:hypothetical protein
MEVSGQLHICAAFPLGKLTERKMLIQLGKSMKTPFRRAGHFNFMKSL